MDIKTRNELQGLAAEALFVFDILETEFKARPRPRLDENCELIAAKLTAGIMAGRGAEKSGARDAN
ncbi:hypothetical protein OKW38_002243 [Paraburkholderia sp. MM5496-R1]|uniref:hypothetical protein n=1 Tax=Paraburkholderia sp. MM5496-R1 TaxID=2991065 RepID=UPI003D230160